MSDRVFAAVLALALLPGVSAHPSPAHAGKPGAGVQEPNVALTVAVIDAGGGAQHYDTVALFHTLAGHLAGAEFIKLRMQNGKGNVESFLSVFNFAVQDIVATFKDEHVNMNVSPEPDPHDGKALAAALVAQASDSLGTLSVDVMLDHMLSPGAHSRVRSDIQKKFGMPSDDNYRMILLQTLQDMKRAYHL